MLTFFIPLPPSTNHLFATVRGRRVKSKAYKSWISLAFLEMRRTLNHYCTKEEEGLWSGNSFPKEKLPVSITVLITGGKGCPRSRDGDNFLKPICDLMVVGGLLPGDSFMYVHEHHVAFTPAKGMATCRVVLEPAGSIRCVAHAREIDELL